MKWEATAPDAGIDPASDRQIETLLYTLDKHLVSKNFALIFSSAHGATRGSRRPSRRLW